MIALEQEKVSCKEEVAHRRNAEARVKELTQNLLFVQKELQKLQGSLQKEAEKAYQLSIIETEQR